MGVGRDGFFFQYSKTILTTFGNEIVVCLNEQAYPSFGHEFVYFIKFATGKKNPEYYSPERTFPFRKPNELVANI